MRLARGSVTTMLAAVFTLSACAGDSYARQGSRRRAGGKKSSAPAKEKEAGRPESELTRLRAQLVQATREYKSSLEQLLVLDEAEVRRADERVVKTRELHRAGLVSKRELERDEEASELARAKVARVEGQLKSADVQIADVLVEAEAEEEAEKALAKARTAPRAAGGLLTTTAYIRYGGTRAWSLSEAGAVGQFFARSFGRQLPVSSFGQSPVHDRWGYAHHNAMDVGVSPDTVEGRALMEYLRGAGIPFTAFRHAIPGTATGPHIHVGRPSHKITPR